MKKIKNLKLMLKRELAKREIARVNIKNNI